MDNPTYKVYVKTNTDGNITAINSSVFLSDTTDWTQIDEGIGDKYAHAQGNYFDKPIINENACYNYKLVDGKPVERTDAEKKAEIEARPAPAPTKAEVLGQQIASMALENSQKDSTIQQLGEQMVQAQLEIMTLKGSATA